MNIVYREQYVACKHGHICAVSHVWIVKLYRYYFGLWLRSLNINMTPLMVNTDRNWIETVEIIKHAIKTHISCNQLDMEGVPKWCYNVTYL